ncbi:MAG: hypothetical protein MK138_02805, partial [Planctomycetes bacterium]|nr:hypothetical protein [Planctomycetota bacterium]
MFDAAADRASALQEDGYFLLGAARIADPDFYRISGEIIFMMRPDRATRSGSYRIERETETSLAVGKALRENTPQQAAFFQAKV